MVYVDMCVYLGELEYMWAYKSYDHMALNHVCAT